MLGLIPARAWLYLVGALALIAILTAAKVSYDRRVTQPYRDEVARLHAGIEAQKREAVATLERIKAEHADQLRAFEEKARSTDESHAAAIAQVRAAGNAADGIRLFDHGRGRGEGCGSAPATGAGPAGGAEAAPAEPRELSGDLAAFLKREAIRADEVATYAATCHRFVNETLAATRGGIRAGVRNNLKGAAP